MSMELVRGEVAVAPANLFGSDDPDAIIRSATAKANALARVINEKNLTTTISGRQHVRVEGWTLLGTLMGVFPVCVWSRPVQGGWEARVEARTLEGNIVGAAEAQCGHEEYLWSERSEFALRSMAQTRATSKALRSALGFVMALAGYDSTPAEEMVEDPSPTRKQQRAPQMAPRVTRGGSLPPERRAPVVEGAPQPVIGNITFETKDSIEAAYLLCQSMRGREVFREEVYPVLVDRWPKAFTGTANLLKVLSEEEGKAIVEWLTEQTPLREEDYLPPQPA